MTDFKPTLCLDWDGVIHSYERGWQGGEIYGTATPGFFEWAERVRDHFELVIYSSRSKSPDGLATMAFAFERWIQDWADSLERPTPLRTFDFKFASEKPAAWLTIDDRSIHFEGNWSASELSLEAMLAFRPWTVPQAPPSDKATSLRQAIAQCAVQFRSYEQQHLAKTPPDVAKAETNATYAAMCEALLRGD